MFARFVRFLALFNMFLIISVLAFLHYGSLRFNAENLTEAAAWKSLVDFSFNLVIFIFYFLLAALIVFFVVYLRRSK
ncbi:hypothetical protein A3G55_02540 [Candidatus Giovannonibacteria bacterium RIFCSPLOWO2_12_FULL_44_25]|uniref:Uncharacterized protein n=2 Tax=Candidatus Giovannoniibacteriota TaxID=1752738 RepID=A0A1F5WBH0_9BACT|nr:MAG: hypothetical protein UW15_C0032G0007 [Parcubacteria group bacterium GW2011_GWC1_44_10]KKT59043.1 MAG: hypothetical protein UW53_C0024G0011 [Candidatus Giovannonibacteria bacterium GW2011_GWA1_44_25]KKU29236.1 MAG: hypothetical protein UX43_C0014G0011 [Candidatus Giovannonibacteria bacterium GW2011_GWB1_46_20]OGF49890.1 MAG: hypothetical protein A2120_04340 [Candidatus Giovannonibacteria bacterium GWA2_45_15]OGF59980.1 MAG: hypothetical protein A2W40_02900 [Candidatus Giovannonibacteria 